MARRATKKVAREAPRAGLECPRCGANSFREAELDRCQHVIYDHCIMCGNLFNRRTTPARLRAPTPRMDWWM